MVEFALLIAPYAALSDQELVSVCAHGGDALAWKEFVGRFHKLIALIVMRTAREWGESSPQMLDDLIQEVYLKLCENRCHVLRDFKPEHEKSHLGYLKIVACNTVRDCMRAKQARKRGADQIVNTAELQEVVAGRDSTVEQDILLDEIDDFLRARAAADDRDRHIFWLYYRHGLTAREIATVPAIRLTVKGVESTIHRLTKLVRGELGGGGPSSPRAATP